MFIIIHTRIFYLPFLCPKNVTNSMEKSLFWEADSLSV
jgi:hypothetical protein